MAKQQLDLDKMLGAYRPHKRVQMKPVGDSRTHQSFAAECDINNIMKKYEKTGLITHVKEYGRRYGDFLGAPDYHTACNQVREAEEMFLTVPASVRAKFGNDPAQFLAFVQDEENRDAMREMGLLDERPLQAVEEALEGADVVGGPPDPTPASSPEAEPEPAS